jgi:hypothetical protein
MIKKRSSERFLFGLSADYFSDSTHFARVLASAADT